MKTFRIFLIRLILFLGQRTFIGRGKLRRIIIIIIRYIIFSNKIKNDDSINENFVVSVLGVPFIFFINKNTKDNSIFFDIGANMGMYTQMIASNFNKIKNSIIVAIEPDPLNCYRIRENLKLLQNKIPNIFDKVKIEECAVGDFNKNFFLNQSAGPANGAVSQTLEKDCIKVKMKTLLNIIENNKISYITNLKIDIEGYEDKCLLPFFNNASKKLYPDNIIIEAALGKLWGVNIIDYLKSIGYKIFYSSAANMILRLK